MTPQDKAPKIREVVVANDPNNHGALVGHVDASQFPIGGPDGVGHISPGPNPYDLLSVSRRMHRYDCSFSGSAPKTSAGEGGSGR